MSCAQFLTASQTERTRRSQDSIRAALGVHLKIMVQLDAAHAAVHYPQDRRFRIWVRPSILIRIALVIGLLVAAAWLEVAIAGLPHVPPVPQVYPNNFAGPHAFLPWVRYCHFFNPPL